MKGQSAIEYLTTYGWMVLAVTVAGTTFYSTVDVGCEPSINRVGDTELSLSTVATTTDGLELELESPSTGEVTVDEVNITNKNITRVNSKKVDAEGTNYLVANANKTEGGSCETLNLQVVYDTEYLSNQDAEYEVRVPVAGLEEIIRFLRIGGGQIPEIESQSSLKPTNGSICFGDDCPSEENQSKNSRVERSGDTIYGTVKTKRITFNCVGDGCENQTGDNPGYLNETSNTVDGTLFIKSFKPVNKIVCIGDC